MKKVCRLLLSVISLVVVFGLATPFLASAEMVKKVDNFVVFMDQSGSMSTAKAEAGNQKFDQAVGSVTRMDQVVPELGYTGSVALFAPFKTVTGAAEYKKGVLGSAVGGVVPPFNAMTPMAEGFEKIDPVIGGLGGKTALIVYTDGVSNVGSDPVAAAKSLYGKYTPNLCIHVVSYADTPQGKQTVDAIRALSNCSVAVDGKALADDATLAKFVKDVLYEDVQPAPAPAPAPVAAPAPAPAPVAKEVITFNLLFGFDKWAITDEMVPVLEQAKMILDEDPKAEFVVSGHTDSTGPEVYNQGLSERRAASVKKWLVDNGVSAARLETVGYGETRAKYDNGTKEGRKLNRRVELQTK